jgi:DNA (cytosine-5)-methyltransferase 1
MGPPAPVGEPVGEPVGNLEYSCFQFTGTKYRIGDSVYLPPDTHRFSVRRSKNSVATKTPMVQRDREDETRYPELYRKSEYIKGSNSDVPKPFQIGV